ncbi:MAG: NAD(P)-binding protein [Gemmatimonadaceae bacterium]|nr:NAD(P)-binding protein [Gemmatimonadaceae bacterium]
MPGPGRSGDAGPCRAGCPVGTDASAYVALMDEGRFAEAYDVARQHNPFASVCGRVCSAPCERACRRGVIDIAVSIRALKRVLCDAHGAEQGDASRWMRAVGEVPAATRGSVGIIGAGPAGLAAAHDLRASGFAVTVYESMPAAGGMMRYGIPAFRLPHDVLNAEIDAIASLGVEIRLGCVIGRDVLVRRSAHGTRRGAASTVGCQQGRHDARCRGRAARRGARGGLPAQKTRVRRGNVRTAVGRLDGRHRRWQCRVRCGAQCMARPDDHELRRTDRDRRGTQCRCRGRTTIP